MPKFIPSESPRTTPGTTKTEDEMWGETLFRQLPKNPDGTVTFIPRTLRPKEDFNDLMMPMNTREPRKTQS